MSEEFRDPVCLWHKIAEIIGEEQSDPDWCEKIDQTDSVYSRLPQVASSIRLMFRSGCPLRSRRRSFGTCSWKTAGLLALFLVGWWNTLIIISSLMVVEVDCRLNGKEMSVNRKWHRKKWTTVISSIFNYLIKAIVYIFQVKTFQQIWNSILLCNPRTSFFISSLLFTSSFSLSATYFSPHPSLFTQCSLWWLWEEDHFVVLWLQEWGTTN